MQFVAPTVSSVFWLPVTVIIFLAPGWLLVRKLGSPAPLVSAFLGSAAILFQLILALNALHVPLHVGTIGLGIALVAVLLIWRTTGGAKVHTPQPLRFEMTGWTWLWLAPAAVALGSIAIRAMIDPLSGYDNGTRWDYLARLFLAHGSLAGYPPMTSVDFEYYSWCDGIPPLVPLLNFWIYTSTGSIAPALTAVRVIGEALLLGSVVARYSQLLWGKPGGLSAIAALVTSALAIWAVAMGQETGLTAIALVAMLYFLELYARTPERTLIFWAAVAAGIGALTREYGLSFPLLGLAVLASRQQIHTGGTIFAITGFGLSAPWYLRNWIITGNPLYPQTLGGLFPGNRVHDEIMLTISDYWGFQNHAFSPIHLVQSLAVLGGVLTAFGMVGAWRAGSRSFPLVAGIILILGLWIWSIPQTAGGWIYSMRMLSPMLALLAVLTGWMGTLKPLLRIVCLTVCCATGADAARRAWLLPDLPFGSALSVSFAEWRASHASLQDIGSNPLWDVLVRDAAGRGIVVEHTADHALVTMRGGRAIALVSPLLAPTFADQIPFAEAVATLRAAGVRFITISVKNPMRTRLIKAHPFWNELCFRHAPIAEVQSLDIFDLDQLLPLASALPTRSL